MMAFRVGGALESLQEQYFLLNLCFSMVTFDLQAQVHAQTSLWLRFGASLPLSLSLSKVSTFCSFCTSFLRYKSRRSGLQRVHRRDLQIHLEELSFYGLNRFQAALSMTRPAIFL